MLRASALRAHTHTGATGLTVTLAQAEASRRYAAQRPAGINKARLHRTTRRVESPVATSDLDAWDLGPVTILSMQPTRGFPNNIHPGGLYRLTACTHQCTTSSRQHTATQSPRHVSRQAGPPGRTCHVHASTWTNLPERLSALHARALTGLRPLRETHRRFQNVPRRRPLMSKTYLRFGPMPAKAIS